MNDRPQLRSSSLGLGCSLALVLWPACGTAQDLEPRRWTHVPVGTNIVGANYGFTTGEVLFDPVLELDDVQMDVHTLLGSYTRAFDLFGKTGRVDVLVPVQTARWKGLLSGNPASTGRDGLADPWVRFSVGLIGAPALRGQEFLEYRKSKQVHTILGAALGMRLPLGQYDETKLINLGENRFTFRPQMGVTHLRGAWSYELTGSVFFYTDNTEFFGGTTRTQDPVFALQGHVVHTFSSRWWASVGVGYNWGGSSEIDGQPKNDERRNLLYSLSLGVPITESQGIKVGYFRGDALADVGSDTHTLFLAWNIRF